jgi:hypothetical protein
MPHTYSHITKDIYRLFFPFSHITPILPCNIYTTTNNAIRHLKLQMSLLFHHATYSFKQLSKTLYSRLILIARITLVPTCNIPIHSIIKNAIEQTVSNWTYQCKSSFPNTHSLNFHQSYIAEYYNYTYLCYAKMPHTDSLNYYLHYRAECF